jgi:hypothetical protein
MFAVYVAIFWYVWIIKKSQFPLFLRNIILWIEKKSIEGLPN